MAWLRRGVAPPTPLRVKQRRLGSRTPARPVIQPPHRCVVGWQTSSLEGDWLCQQGKRHRGSTVDEDLGRGVTAGAGALVGATAAGAGAVVRRRGGGGPTSGDVAILGAAQIAEALAVTTYTNIINTAPFFKRLADDDQGYLKAARQEEMSHYLLEKSVTGKPSPFTTFYYPPKMFSDAQTTLNVLVTLEDAFIAAYLVGVRDFSTPDLRVTAARIMGIESDHRTLARVVGRRRGARRTAARSRRSPASRARPRASTRRTTTATSARCAGRTSARRSTALTPFADKTAAGEGGFRHQQGVQVQAVHAEAARTRSANSTRSPAERTRRSLGSEPKWGLEGRDREGGARARRPRHDWGRRGRRDRHIGVWGTATVGTAIRGPEGSTLSWGAAMNEVQLLDEQRAYYRARAGEYDSWWLREGRYDHGREANRRWFEEIATLEREFDGFAPAARCSSWPAEPGSGHGG